MYKKDDLTKPFYKTGEVAKMVNLHPRTIQGYCDSGRIVFTRSSTNIRLISKDALIEFLTELGMLLDDKYSLGYIRIAKDSEYDEQCRQLLMSVLPYNPVNMKIIKELNVDESEKREQLEYLLDEIVSGKVDKLFVLSRNSFGLVTYHIVKHLCDKHDVKLYILEELTDEN